MTLLDDDGPLNIIVELDAELLRRLFAQMVAEIEAVFMDVYDQPDSTEAMGL